MKRSRAARLRKQKTVKAFGLNRSPTSNRRGKGAKIMLLVVGYGSPLPASAPLGETNLSETLLDQCLSPRQPTQLVYDREPDSDDRRERSRKRGLDPGNKRTRENRQDSLLIRRFTRRWTIRHTNSSLHKLHRDTVEERSTEAHDASWCNLNLLK